MGRHAGVRHHKENAYRFGSAEGMVKRRLDLIREAWLPRES
jgi:hypothetical protein